MRRSPAGPENAALDRRGMVQQSRRGDRDRDAGGAAGGSPERTVSFSSCGAWISSFASLYSSMGISFRKTHSTPGSHAGGKMGREREAHEPVRCAPRIRMASGSRLRLPCFAPGCGCSLMAWKGEGQAEMAVRAVEMSRTPGIPWSGRKGCREEQKKGKAPPRRPRTAQNRYH